MNYGRGAGKTYTLKLWAMKNLNTRVLVTKHPDAYRGTNIDRFGNVWGYDSDPKQFLERISRGDGAEIAFDDFDLADIKHTQLLATVQVMGVKSVILATTHEALETEAAKKSRAGTNQFLYSDRKVGSWKPSDEPPLQPFKYPKHDEDKKIEGAVAEGIIKAAGYIGREYIKQHNARVETDGFSINEQGGLTVRGNIKVPEESEPIQKVKVCDLRIGDWLVGKGCVMSIGVSETLPHTHLSVDVKQNAPVFFTGTLHTSGETLIDVDTTQRK